MEPRLLSRLLFFCIVAAVAPVCLNAFISGTSGRQLTLKVAVPEKQQQRQTSCSPGCSCCGRARSRSVGLAMTASRGSGTDRMRFLQSSLVASAAAVQGLLYTTGAAQAFEKGDDLRGAIFKNERLVKVKEGLKGLQAAQRTLVGFETTYIPDKDWFNMRGSLRVPPFSGVRVDSRNIMAYAEDEDRPKVDAAYRKFIASVEKMDQALLQGVKKSLTDESKIEQEYGHVVENFDALLEAIPGGKTPVE